jgi:hypothetical protein
MGFIAMNRNGRVGIAVVGIFAFITGLGEIIVGFTGNYLGILSHGIALNFTVLGRLGAPAGG